MRGGGGRGGAQTWGSGGTHRLGSVSRLLPLLEGASSPPVAPPSPQICLQALGQLRLVADGAGTAVQAVIVTGQAAGRYLAIWAAAG